jgi:hypothetical protein
MTCSGAGAGDSLHQDTEPCAVCGYCTSDSDSYVGCCTCVKEKRTSSKWRDSTHWRAIRAMTYRGSHACDLCRHYAYKSWVFKFKRVRNLPTEQAWEAKRIRHRKKHAMLKRSKKETRHG